MRNMKAIRKRLRKEARSKERKQRRPKGNAVVLNEKGPPCPRCGGATEVREHSVVRDKQLKQPFYYSRWFRCRNGGCKTTLIMPQEFKVYPTVEAAKAA